MGGGAGIGVGGPQGLGAGAGLSSEVGIQGCVYRSSQVRTSTEGNLIARQSENEVGTKKSTYLVSYPSPPPSPPPPWPRSPWSLPRHQQQLPNPSPDP